MDRNFLTPVGRLVAGNVFTPNTTDNQGKPLLIKSGPNIGQPTQDFFIALAIPKNDPGWPALEAQIKAIGVADFPGGETARPDFAWKIDDGDSTVLNKANKKNCDKQGYPGHWVIRFGGSFAPQVYSTGATELLTDPERIKRGYYIRVYGSCKGNSNPQMPSVYLNPSMVEFIGYGEELTSGPDGAAIFGGAPVAALPAGASATPLAPATPLAAPVAAAPVAAAPVAAAPVAAAPNPPAVAPVAAAPVGPPATTMPAPDFLAPPVAPVAPVAVVAPVDPEYMHNGVVVKQSQLIGWTPEQIATLTPVEIPF